MVVGLAQTIEDAFDSIMPFDEISAALLNAGINVWNNLLSVAYALLGLNIKDFSGGAGYHLVVKVSPVFATVGTILMLLFYFYGLYNESFEDKQFDVWGMAKSIALLSLGEFLLTNCNKIMSIILKACGGIISTIGGGQIDGLKIHADSYVPDFEAMNFGPGIGFIAVLITLITMLVMLLCSGVIIYVVYFRYIKILICMPFAPLAISTITGNSEVRRTSAAYLRYFCSLALESIVIMLALMFCNVILSGGMPELVTAMESAGWHTGDLTTVILDCFFIMFTCCLTVGSVKGAEQLASRMIG